MSAVIIRGGRVIDPSRKMDATLDVLLVDGKVAEVGESLAAGHDGSEPPSVAVSPAA